ncbi:hypothetical protein B0H14DRAFT_2642717 [Mycena olivaceomarginata]|nr:hypothetical protein B0H14DRAFT_2642717 [Mycena olivaceomarginata]
MAQSCSNYRKESAGKEKWCGSTPTTRLKYPPKIARSWGCVPWRIYPTPVDPSSPLLYATLALPKMIGVQRRGDQAGGSFHLLLPSHPSLQSHHYLIKACKIKWALCKTYLNHFAPMIRAFGMHRANPDSNSPPLQCEALTLGAIVPEFSHTLQTKAFLDGLHHADPVRSGLVVPVRAVVVGGLRKELCKFAEKRQA